MSEAQPTTQSKICGGATILLAADVEKSANYDRDQLGFHYHRFWGDPPGFCILHRDRFSVMLALARDPQDIVPRHRAIDEMWDIYFWVTDADAMFREFQEAGAKLAYGPQNTSYGCREFGVKDLDGHIIAFGQDLDEPQS